MSIVENFADVRILCIGDVMLDQFIDGAIERISPESPVPVFAARGTEIYPGGAANVARNIAALGGKCTLLGAIGEDAAGRRLIEDLRSDGLITPALVVCTDRPTTEKTRFVAQGQHVLRVDREIVKQLSAEAQRALLARAAEEMGSHDVLLLSDYAKGVLTDEVIRGVIALAREKDVPVVVDPKSSDLHRYASAAVITPNSKEIEAATGIDPKDDEQAFLAALKGMEVSGADAILVTRAGQGMTLVRRDKQPVHIPSCAREVFDVVGAGDTVIAALSLALGTGADLEEASRVANVAAGISVSRRGTSTVSQGELLEELSNTRMAAGGPHVAKILNWTEARLCVQAWRSAGKRIAFTNGCFDILHLGHVRLLDFARASGDKLIVGLNDDVSVRRLKGAARPINTQEDRAEILAAFERVDAVVLFGQDTPMELINLIDPDILVKGADYAAEQIVGADYVLAHGGKVLRFELLEGKSSTNLIQKFREDISS